MKRVMTIATAGVAAVLLALSMSVSAQDFNTQERTFLTFSAPVEMPGVTLQPGTYVFKLADSPSRNVVQVFDKDEKNIMGQWLFVQAQRPDVTGETVITFKERAENTTPAVQFWYYPGEKIGKEFIYPKDQALKIAARTGATVKTEEGDVTAPGVNASTAPSSGVVNGSGIASVDNSGYGASTSAEAQVAVSEAAPAASSDVQAQTTASGTPRNVAANGTSGRYDPPLSRGSSDRDSVGTSGSANQSASATDNSNVRQESTTAYNNSELPRTASPLPLSGLLGFLSLAGAAGLRRIRRQ
jgi:hypothetical protein